MKWVLIFWFGAGHSSVFDVSIFDTQRDCEQIRHAVIEYYKNDWSGPGKDTVSCIPAPPLPQ